MEICLTASLITILSVVSYIAYKVSDCRQKNMPNK